MSNLEVMLIMIIQRDVALVPQEPSEFKSKNWDWKEYITAKKQKLHGQFQDLKNSNKTATSAIFHGYVAKYMTKDVN